MPVASGAEPLAGATRDFVLLVTDNRRRVAEAAGDGCDDAAFPVANVVLLQHLSSLPPPVVYGAKRWIGHSQALEKQWLTGGQSVQLVGILSVGIPIEKLQLIFLPQRPTSS
jgi:hypothetical protein